MCMRRLFGVTLFVHRWAGILFGVPALLWFGSIFAMHAGAAHFTLTPEQQLRAFAPRLEAPDLARVIPPPVPDSGPPARQATLHRVLDHLVWVTTLANGATLVSDAVTGRAEPALRPDAAARLAALAVGADPGGARVARITQYDALYYYDGQGALPAYRVRLADAGRTDAYVNPRTGAVTTAMDAAGRRYRLLGTLPHFTQFWPLDGGAGPRNVVRLIALSGNLLGALCGVIFGLWLLASRWRSLARRRTVTRGIRLVHYWLAVAACVVFLAWTASGYLMFLWFQTVAPGPEELTRLREPPLTTAAFRLTPRDAVAAARESTSAPVVALRARMLLGRPVYDVVHPDGSSTLVDAASGVARPVISTAMLRQVVGRFLGAPPAIRTVQLRTRYDAYYYGEPPDAPPLPAYRVEVANAGAPSPIYVAAETGALSGRVSRAYRVFRWVGQGIHTFDFPPLAERPELRDILVLLPASLGVLVALSGLWLGIRHVARAVGRWRRGVVTA
jgi:hypothetical protein